MKDHAILGLKQKGLHVKGEGNTATYSLEETKCHSWLHTHTRHEKAKTAGRSKSVTAKIGMQVHPDCRERGCQRLCETQVIPFPATQVEQPVAQERRAEDQTKAVKAKSVPGASTRPPESPPPKPTAFLPTDLQQLLGIFLSLGVAMSEADTRKCGKIWSSLKSTEKTTALAYATARQENEWSECAVRYVPRPWNYLGEKHWERASPVKPRTASMSKGERASKIAREQFYKEMGFDETKR
jgi:hypothetical protein